jgi:hypothetical protein
MIMKIRMMLAVALTLLAVSACVIEPIGGRGYYGGGGNDYGPGVWRGSNHNGTNFRGWCRAVMVARAGDALFLVPGGFAKIDLLGVRAGTGDCAGAAADNCTGHDADGAANEANRRSGGGACRAAALRAAGFGCSASCQQCNDTCTDELCHEVHGERLCFNARYCRAPGLLALLASASYFLMVSSKNQMSRPQIRRCLRA